MSRAALEELMDQWMNDGVFRGEFREDPEGTVRQLGVELTGEEWQSLKELATSAGETLEPRISRS